MPQIVKIVDLSKSYLPGDPNALLNNLHYTSAQDEPDKAPPVIPYEGYNFLPTSYGYRSYFGDNATITLEALPKPCDEVFIFQSLAYENLLVALCSDGIRTARSNAVVWTKAISLTDDWLGSGVYRQYTWCVIENDLYIYRQGYAKVIKISKTLVVSEFTPSFLNMAGQMGIFRGNGRLCFWDSANSVSWSSAFDLTDFTPSIENMVGNSIFLGVVGRIVMILPHGEGFVIYCTRSIVGVSYSTVGTGVWDAMAINSQGGITHPKAVTIGTNDKEHFAYTTVGILSVGHFNALSRQYASEKILPELFDYLKESRDPVYLQCHAGRFLYFSLIDDSYINGITSFTDVEYPSLSFPVITVNNALFSLWDNNYDLLTTLQEFQLIDSWFKKADYNITADYTAASFSIPKWVAAGTKGLLTTAADTASCFPHIVKGDTTYDLYNVNGAAIASYGTLSECLAAASVYANQEHLGTDVAGYLETIAANLASELDVVAGGGTLIQTDLYPSRVVNPSAAKTTWETLYNFLETIDEEMNLLEANALDLIATVEELNNTEVTWTLLSTTPVQNDFSVPNDVYIPRKSSRVSVTFRDADLVNFLPAALDINVGYPKATLITFAGSSRSIGESTLIPNPNNPNNGGDTNYKLVVKNPLDYRISQNFALDLFHLNFELETEQPFIFSGSYYYATTNVLLQTPEYELSGVYTGLNVKMYQLNGTPAQSASIKEYKKFPNNLYAHAYTIKNKAEIDPYFMQGNDLYYNETGDPNDFDTSPPYAALVTGMLGTPASYNFPLVGNPALICDILNTLSNPFASAAYHTCGITIDVISNIHDWYYDPSENAIGASFNWTHPGGTGSFTKLLFLLKTNTTGTINLSSTLPPQDSGISEYTYSTPITETISVNAIDTDMPTGSYGAAIHALTFTAQGYDTYTKQLDSSYLKTAEVVTFDPVVTAAVPFGASDADFEECFIYNIYEYVWLPGSADCVRWMFRKNATSLYGTDFMSHTDGTLVQVPMPLGPIANLMELSGCYPESDNPYTERGTGTLFTYPGGTFTLQDGVPVPAYPVFVGSLVLDTGLKKWGKQAGEFKCLLQFSPINATNDQAIDTTNFGMDSGILDSADSKIKLFDAKPAASLMRYGKIALYRLGFTEILEITINFRTRSTGTIVVDGSIDGREIELPIQHTHEFTDVRQTVVKCHVNAMWHTISITGNFDLQYLEFRGIVAARR